MLLTIVSILIFFKLFAVLTCGKFNSKCRLNGKTVIVTGSNTGLGKETALDLAKRGARVIMACRNISEANSVRDEIILKSGNHNVVVLKLDISSLESVRKFAEVINQQEERLDVLMHNAGVALGNNPGKSVDGLELTFATNHFGPFLLTHLLVDLMKRTKSSRIIILTSLLGFLSFTDFQKFNFDSYENTNNNYCISKHANLLITRELAERLKGTGITVNCVHPGAVYTRIFNDQTLTISLFFTWSFYLFMKTPEQGAQTQNYAAVDENLNEVTGKLFIDCVGFPIYETRNGLRNQRALWRKSEEIVGLKEEEKIIKKSIK